MCSKGKQTSHIKYTRNINRLLHKTKRTYLAESCCSENGLSKVTLTKKGHSFQVSLRFSGFTGFLFSVWVLCLFTGRQDYIQGYTRMLFHVSSSSSSLREFGVYMPVTVSLFIWSPVASSSVVILCFQRESSLIHPL